MTLSRKLFFVIALVQCLHISNCHYGQSTHGNHITELSCNDNATCIEHLTKEIVNGIKNNKTIRLFDLIDIEPIASSVPIEERSTRGVFAKFFDSHALKVDFGNYGVRVLRSPTKGASVAVDIDYDSGSLNGEGRGRQKKIMRVILPLILGFKAASTLIVAIAAVALLTFKAFLASKLALLVTGTMVVKKFMESFSGGMDAQHHPYMYNQYPIDFSSAGTHPGYTMGQTAYASPEMYGVSGVGGHPHEMLQQPAAQEQAHDVSGQYSQGILDIQNPNITAQTYSPQATKRWDGLKKKPMYYENNHPLDRFTSYQEN